MNINTWIIKKGWYILCDTSQRFLTNCDFVIYRYKFPITLKEKFYYTKKFWSQLLFILLNRRLKHSFLKSGFRKLIVYDSYSPYSSVTNWVFQTKTTISIDVYLSISAYVHYVYINIFIVSEDLVVFFVFPVNGDTLKST